MNADGSGVVNLTKHPSDDSYPQWSPDGAMIAFRSDRDGNDEVYVMRGDGSGLVRLTNDPSDDGPAYWHPGGALLSFTSLRGGSSQAYVMAADGSHVRQISKGFSKVYYGAAHEAARSIGTAEDRLGGEKNMAVSVARWVFVCCAIALAPEVDGRAQVPSAVTIPVDSSRWEHQGQSRVAEFLGRKSILIDGGAAVLPDLEFRDGVIDVDVATPASRGFFGIQFRITDQGANADWVYLRQHKSGLPDALQYTPVLNTGLNWQIYNGPGFTGRVEIPRNVWFHLRLEVIGAQAKLFVEDMNAPVLVVDDLKSGNQRGQIALAVLTGATYFSNFTIRQTPDAAWTRRLPPMPKGTLTTWDLSPSYDALARDLERPLTPSEIEAIPWQEVEAEAPGFVPVNRYRDSPHPRVSFANDFSKRLEPQPGMRVVYARTHIDSDRDQVKKLNIGYSDDVSVFLNGKILYRGRSAQNFRAPGFLGIMNPENDAVYLPLQRGRNELLLAVSELGGGWGFICRLE